MSNPFATPNQLNLQGLAAATPHPSVSVLAGTPSGAGNLDGLGTAGRFNQPCSVAVDSQGNAYVADSLNFRIRKVTPAGAVSTVAGSGTRGSTDGAGASASFGSPTGVAVDGAGTLFVTDPDNHAIRTISPDGVVATLADPAASIQYPTAVAADRAGNLFVVDSDKGCIFKVTPDGQITAWAQAGSTPSSVSFQWQPIGLSVSSDSQGVTVLHLVSQDGRLARVVEALPAPTWTLLQTFNAARALCVAAAADGTLYLGTPGGLQVCPPNGTFSAMPVTAGRFGTVSAMAVEPSGDILVADADQNTISRYSQGQLRSWVGTSGHPDDAKGTGAAAPFRAPQGLVMDASGTVFVADTDNHRIQLIAPDGRVTTLLASPVDNTHFDNPEFLALDSQGNLYVSDGDCGVIDKVALDGTLSLVAGTYGQYTPSDVWPGQFFTPRGLAVDAQANVYVADDDDHTIRLITADQKISTYAGQSGVAGSANGPRGVATFRHPTALALDPDGNLYVLDANSVRVISATGMVSTLVGSLTEDPSGLAAAFQPLGMTRDGAGNLFVAGDDHTVRMIQPNGEVSILLGVPGKAANLLDGNPPLLYCPCALAVDPRVSTGTLLIAVSGAVLKVSY